MKTFSLPFRLALAIALLASTPAALNAQSVDDIRAVTRDADISEDLAVMSKIVQAKVGALYGEGDDLALWVHHDATWPQIAEELADSKIAAPLAHHLDGYGVVLQMQLPGVRPTPADEPDEETANDSATLWNQVRGRLRGERAMESIDSQFSQSCQQCHAAASVPVLSKIPYMHRLFNAQQGKWNAPTREELVGALLDILAENGHNFRHLAADERVAIAVSIQSWQHPRTAAANSIDALVLNRWMALGVSPHGGSLNQFGSQGTDAAGDDEDVPEWQQGFDMTTPIGNREEVTNNYELAGDLHARQGRLDEAILAFDKALRTGPAEVQQAPDDEGAQPSKAERQSHDVVRLWRKLATVHHQAGQSAEAQKYLNLATQATREINGNAQPSPSEEPQADYLDLLNHPTTRADMNRYYLDLFGVPAPNSGEATVPARLTVSAIKSLLDQVAAGEITREQFKSLASVRFTPAQDKPPSAGQ